MFANSERAQDDLTIISRPDPGGDFGAYCREALTVRGVAGASCSSGPGATIVWVERGWRYQLSGGLLSTAQALALAESLEFVTPEIAAQRLSV